MARFDVAVIGLGSMGSAVLAQCVRRGMRAIGFEQFDRLHDRGSWSGRSRMIRKAYYEHPSYVPLLLRAYDAWHELESEANAKLLRITGLLMVGSERSEVLSGAMRSASQHALPVERMDRSHVRDRFPMFTLRDGESAVYEADGGFIDPEAAVEAYLRRAEQGGAVLRFGAPAWLDQALEYAPRVVVCSGAWLDELNLGIPIEVERNVQHWFAASDERFAIGRCPAFLIDRDDYPHMLYGFPDYGEGVKAAFHGSDQITGARHLDRLVHESDIEPVRAALDQALPGAAGVYLRGKACMYALSPDRHFVISPHPRDARIIVAGGFSGHGFKFVPVVGEIVSMMVAGERPAYDLEFLSASRFMPNRR